MFFKIIKKLSRKRSETVVSRVTPYLSNSSKIIDIGSGTGDVSSLLIKQGKDVTPVDVNTFHGVRLVKTVIYDGEKLPFPDRSFDTALLLMVLHHTLEPEKVFLEASRVAREIVVIETSYTNPLNKWFTVILDTLGNLRLDAHWSSYKTDSEWRNFFENHGFNISESQKYWDKNFGVSFLHISYHLTRPS